MTDRINSMTVTLEGDIRIDDAEQLINAISMIKGVIDVTPNVANMESHIAKVQAKAEIRNKLYEAFKDA